jgi:hypothetical protein
MYGEFEQDHYMGQLGELIPLLIGANIVAISAGPYHCLLLDKDGNVYSSGGNEGGERGMGHADEIDEMIPLRIPNLSSIVSISAKSDGLDPVSYFIDKEGVPYVCGYLGSLMSKVAIIPTTLEWDAPENIYPLPLRLQIKEKVVSVIPTKKGPIFLTCNGLFQINEKSYRKRLNQIPERFDNVMDPRNDEGVYSFLVSPYESVVVGHPSTRLLVCDEYAFSLLPLLDSFKSFQTLATKDLPFRCYQCGNSYAHYPEQPFSYLGLDKVSNRIFCIRTDCFQRYYAHRIY